MPRPPKGTALPQDDKDIPPVIGTEAGEPWTKAKFRMYLRGAIRKVYFLWPGRKEVIDRSRVEIMVRKKGGDGNKRQVWHVCEKCGQPCKTQHTKKHLSILAPWKKEVAAAKKAGLPLPPRPSDVPFRIWCDHVDPVVGLEGGAPDWHTYIMRTFVTPDKMQALCCTCHSQLTAAQNAERKVNTRVRKIQDAL